MIEFEREKDRDIRMDKRRSLNTEKKYSDLMEMLLLERKMEQLEFEQDSVLLFKKIQKKT